LVIWGLTDVRRRDLSHITYHTNLGKSLEFEIPAEESGQPQLFAAQGLSQQETSVIQSLPGATVYKFKNYTCIAVTNHASPHSCTMAQLHSVASSKLIMPLDSLITSKTLERMVTLHAKKDEQASDIITHLPQELKKQIAGLHILSKSSLRILLKTTADIASLKDILATLPIHAATFNLFDYVRCQASKPRATLSPEEKNHSIHGESRQ